MSDGPSPRKEILFGLVAITVGWVIPFVGALILFPQFGSFILNFVAFLAVYIGGPIVAFGLFYLGFVGLASVFNGVDDAYLQRKRDQRYIERKRDQRSK